ncbi:HDL259Cp [Eremothecium sinecaudum]|uniref:HDL259Cp n=1 Tax=Eremothecium sinecaudum TaxID=45286 RepID=A0A0X8HS60_9SACH|nr:HDL259Cp [Eremothecium sinecaudum]AMD20485.1 HDL259Cp [Eremothecium sinecaudum]
MARRNKGAVSEENPYSDNEVDAFAAKREKVLLEKAGLTRNDASEDDEFLVDDSETVMSLSGEDSSDEDEEEAEDEAEDEELDGDEAYRKVFGRKLNAGDDQEIAGDAMLDNENAWGASKNEYYGADDLDDDEVAKEIEKEALQQQRKHLEDLNMDDYLEDEVEQEWIKTAKEFDVEEFQQSTNQGGSSISVKDVLNMDSEAKENFLKTSFSEFLPLCKEFEKQSAELELLKAEKPGDVKDIKVMALSSYLGTISAYFAIFLHELKHNDDFNTMKGHPVMEKLLTNKEIWRQAKELEDSMEVLEDEQQESEVEAEEQFSEIDGDTLSDENEDVKMEEDQSSAKEDSPESDIEEVFDIDVTKSRISKSRDSVLDDDADDFMETEIADVDAQEKKARKKTLRFYTSKIDQQANKKGDKFKGDDDIPYKERLFERQQRLTEEARKRSLHDPNGEDIEDTNYNSEDERVSKAVNEASENDYYEQIKQSKAEKKKSRMQAHQDALRAAREGKLAELSEVADGDGKRAINYQILKNKGLTPKRKKDNRNARVKKRKKFEKAKKKLKSVRAVYSGGQNGAYEGEKTGIKKNLTKSVKFKS